MDSKRRRNNKIIYCLLISSQIKADPEGYNRNDDIYINMLTERSFKIDIEDNPPGILKWYTDRGFLIEEYWREEGNIYILRGIIIVRYVDVNLFKDVLWLSIGNWQVVKENWRFYHGRNSIFVITEEIYRYDILSIKCFRKYPNGLISIS